MIRKVKSFITSCIEYENKKEPHLFNYSIRFIEFGTNIMLSLGTTITFHFCKVTLFHVTLSIGFRHGVE